MSRLTQNKWKYATIGMLAILAAGFSFPQAFAHVSNNTGHMLQHIYEIVTGIDTKVDQLQADVDTLTEDTARQSEVEDAMFTQVIRKTMNNGSVRDCTSDEDFMVHFVGFGSVTLGDGNYGVALSPAHDANAVGVSYTLGGSGGDTITVESDGGGFVTLQTTEGANASCN
jgi:hypothetical protein